MANYYGVPPNQPAYGPPGGGEANLQFYPTSYAQPVSGHATPSQASYGYGGPSSSSGFGGSGGFGSPFTSGPGGGVSGRMGEAGGLRTGLLAALSAEGYDGEPPLLEELGVNFGHVRAKTLAVLNPFGRIDQHLMDDSDIAGPILFCVLYGTSLLLSGRVHFGFIYGLALVGSVVLHLVLSLMAPSDSPMSSAAAPYASAYPGQPATGPDPSSGSGGAPPLSSTLTFARSTSVLGYCLLPLVVTSFVGIVMPMNTPLGILLTFAAICWCTWSASGIFMVYGKMTQMRLLIAYPLALFYVAFGIMGVFSSRGSSSSGGVAASGGLS
ncbi:putative Golgi membrane protein [Apodospora peruviana]|uniref:Protein YIP n=1 Tax=Apodospora peruviana TaxID=516989 RepID=A0AAE0M295_9PEZI|nr:putative Golgi membrane protein [Apodospora peruviana]